MMLIVVRRNSRVSLSRCDTSVLASLLHITLHQFYAIRPGVPHGEAAETLCQQYSSLIDILPDVIHTKYLQNDRRRVLRTILICREGTRRNIDEKSSCVHTARATLPVDPKLACPD